MFYERKIRYFNYMENGERVRGAGFAKLEVRDKLCFLTIQINNLEASNYSKPVFLLGGERECQLCELHVKQGRGGVQFQLPCDNLCGGVTYGDIRAIRIPIAAGKEIYCEIQEPMKKETLTEQKSDEKIKKEELLEVISDEAKAPQIKVAKPVVSKEKLPDISEQELQQNNMMKVKVAETKVSTMNEHLQQQAIVQPPEKSINLKEEEPPKLKTKQYCEPKVQEAEPKERETRVVLQENKWKQLSEIYKHIAPFQDERDYLSIGPGDFVIFPEKYYKLVNNSFLLHGYYNYKHLILTKMIIRGETRYYMGVPGNFYEREKQVALMFGFESFECQEEPARAGDYGYYMMRVEL